MNDPDLHAALDRLVAAVVAVVVGLPTPAGGPTTPGAPSAAERVDPTTGLTAARAQRIADECELAEWRKLRLTPTAPAKPSRLRLYRVNRDANGAMAILYGPGRATSCWLDAGDRVRWTGSGASKSELPDWMVEPLSVEGSMESPRYSYVLGRVVSAARRVTLSAGSRELAEDRPVNGVYVLLSRPQPSGTRTVLRAYDSGGRLVGTMVGAPRCAVLPDGTRIGTPDANPCPPAVRWR